MKRVFVCILMLFVLAGCADSQDGSVPIEKDLQAIYAEMVPNLPEMMELSDSMMYDLLGINPEFCIRSMAYICDDGLRVDEIWLLEAADAESLDSLKLLAQSRLESQKNIYQSYAPEQYAILEQGKILTEGNYLAFIVSQNADALADIFSE